MYDDIFLFVKLVNCGSFIKTAALLKTTQSTITRRIKSLEEALNLQLINRDSRLMELTADGSALYKKFCDKEQELKTSLDEVRHGKGEVVGTLRIAVLGAFYRYLIAPHIHEFIEKFPKANLIITFTNKQINLIKDNFDIAIATKQPNSLNNKIKLLKRANLKLYASPAYIEQFGAPRTIQELSQHRLVGIAEENIPITKYEMKNLETGTKIKLECKPQVFLNNIIQADGMTHSGHFIINAWDGLAAPKILTGELVPIMPEYSFGELSSYLIRSSGIHSNLEVEFAKFIIDCFSRITVDNQK